MISSKRYFLMLIPDYPTLTVAREFQEAINQEFKLYRVLPQLHVTLDSFVVEDEAVLVQVTQLVEEVCQEYSSFPIVINGFACFGPPYKSVHLNVRETKPLISLYRAIHQGLKELGLETMEFSEGVNFHITLASPQFAVREWTEGEYAQVCKRLEALPLESGFRLRTIELWKPAVKREESLVARFNLDD